jgi:hypothetical protein
VFTTHTYNTTNRQQQLRPVYFPKSHSADDCHVLAGWLAYGDASNMGLVSLPRDHCTHPRVQAASWQALQRWLNEKPNIAIVHRVRLLDEYAYRNGQPYAAQISYVRASHCASDRRYRH